MEKTSRGFDYIEFTDSYGTKCSLQKSSSAMEDKIWFGVNDVNPQIMASDARKLGLNPTEQNGWVNFEIPKEVIFSDRMHLTQQMVHDLMPALIEFADTGDLEDGYDIDFEKEYAIDSFSDDYEIGDFEEMRIDIFEGLKRIKESLVREEKRREKLLKYISGLELAANNLAILIEEQIKNE